MSRKAIRTLPKVSQNLRSDKTFSQNQNYRGCLVIERRITSQIIVKFETLQCMTAGLFYEK